MQNAQTTKSAAIGAAILAHVRSGKSVREAVDAVLGADTFERIAGDVYDTLRARAA